MALEHDVFKLVVSSTIFHHDKFTNNIGCLKLCRQM